MQSNKGLSELIVEQKEGNLSTFFFSKEKSGQGLHPSKFIYRERENSSLRKRPNALSKRSIDSPPAFLRFGRSRRNFGSLVPFSAFSALFHPLPLSLTSPH
jgi:hypothetical protein